MSNLYEALAEYQHDIWASWQKYLHSKCIKNENGSLTIPKDLVDRWNRQIETEYPDLTEKEKDSDREQVDKFWYLLT